MGHNRQIEPLLLESEHSHSVREHVLLFGIRQLSEIERSYPLKSRSRLSWDSIFVRAAGRWWRFRTRRTARSAAYGMEIGHDLLRWGAASRAAAPWPVYIRSPSALRPLCIRCDTAQRREPLDIRYISVAPAVARKYSGAIEFAADTAMLVGCHQCGHWVRRISGLCAKNRTRTLPGAECGFLRWTWSLDRVRCAP